MSTISTTNVAKHATAVPAFAAALALTVPILACASWGDDREGNPLRRFFVTLAVAAIGAVDRRRLGGSCAGSGTPTV